MAPLSFNRVGAPLRSAQIAAAQGITAKNGMQYRQRPGDVVVAASSNPRHACGGPENSGVRATAIATKKGKKMSPHVSSSRPGRIDLIKRGAPTPITLRAKSSFTADHSR
jgi:hypothetical protein